MSIARPGVGPYDRNVLSASATGRQAGITAELDRLERAHTQLQADVLTPLRRNDRILHAGRCDETVGAFRRRFGCALDEDDDWARRDDAVFDAIVDSEVQRGGDLFERCAEVGRVLRPRGRYVFTTWCRNDQHRRAGVEVGELNRKVGIVAQPRATYFAALASAGFVPYIVADLTSHAIPYWQLRDRSDRRTGVELAFLAAYRSRAALLLLVAAELIGTGLARRHRSEAPPARPAGEVPAPASVEAPPPGSFGLGYS